MCGRVPCGGRSGSRNPASGSSRGSRRSTGARGIKRSLGARSGRVRSGRVAQQSVRLGPLIKMKNASEEPVVFNDAMTKAFRSVNPGDWVYVFETQGGDLSSAGMEKMDG